MDKSITSSKHAYCIIAHQDSYCLESLICLLDDEKNDIFLLIDKKADKNLTLNLRTKRGGLNIIPDEERIDIRWGGLSQVKAELILFKAAVSNFHYSYIHLISGADLPLKTQEEIHDSFEKLPGNSNVLAFSEGEHIRKNVEFKTRYYHPYLEFQRFRHDGQVAHLIQDFTAKFSRKVSVCLQKAIGYKRNWKDLELKKGSQWVSISSEFASFLVENEKYILKRFKGVICPDEIFLHTMLYNSKFKDTIIDVSQKEIATIRKIDWERGNPYTWREKDFEELINSDALFARKFSSKEDKEIIDKIKSFLTIIPNP
ncbi:MAG: glycosyl transferase [Muribaculaceae bacterium]|nr:glycosyl transferase [Muribaculaceae bacterium]